jgi:CRP-like cAMP-binding protein
MTVDIETLKSIRYFTDLDPTELEFIKGFIIEKTVNKGEIFLFEGRQSDYLYFVVNGLVKVYKTSPDGNEQILHIAPPGDSLNDVSTFDGGPCAASMLAMTPLHLYAIRKEELRIILKDAPTICINIIKSLANRVRRDSKLVEELSSGQVLARLAKLLLGRYAGEEATIGLSLTQQDMASMVGSRREVVNRSLKILEEKGAIRLSRHRIVVVDKTILSELVKGVEDTLPTYLQINSKVSC